MSKSQAYAILAVALVCVGVIAYMLFSGVSLTTLSDSATTRYDAPPPPPPSVEVQDMLAKSNGFSALVSYTDRGFEPAHTVVRKGDTVRFVNNATTEQLWVASTSTASAYPGASECGGSAFDTCKVLAHGEFWEFTFTRQGEWYYQNNSNTAKTGVIVVQ